MSSKIIKCSKKIILTLLVLALFVLLGVNSIKTTNNNVYAYEGNPNWYTELSQIDQTYLPSILGNEVQTVKISEFYTSTTGTDGSIIITPVSLTTKSTAVQNGIANKEIKILIETALDFYAFTELCNKFVNASEYKQYLTFSYIVGNHIDFIESAKYRNFARPVGWGINNDEKFSGIFDGNGFTISNLYLDPMAANNIDEYRGTDKNGRPEKILVEFYSLFSQVSSTGVIKNLGLINPVILQSIFEENMTYASNLVGLNEGTVDHVYVQDLRDEVGLTAEGGFAVSGLMSINKGTFSNSYVALTSVVSESVNFVLSLAPILTASEKGTQSELYYNSSLLDSRVSTDYGIGVASEAGFTTALKTTEVTSEWFNKDSYTIGVLDSYYPVLTGLRKDETNHYLITSASDYIVMTQLIDNYPIFSTYDYQITGNIDMSTVAMDAFIQSNVSFKGTLSSKKVENVNEKIKLVNGLYSDYYTIFNIDLSKGYSFNSYHAYGLFPFLEGRIYNINFFNINVTIDDTLPTKETIAAGILAGKQEANSRIENVNVYGTISVEDLSNTSSINVGGIVGYSLGTIYSSTVTGKVNGGTYSNGDTEAINIGGLAGQSNGSVINTINDAKLTAANFDANVTIPQSIGGIIGTGSTKDFNKNVNKENIDATATYTGNLYLAGIIGKHSTASLPAYELFNQGELLYNIGHMNAVAYVSGLVNAVEATTTLTYNAAKNGSTARITYSVTPASLTDLNSLNVHLAGCIIVSNANVDAKDIANVSYYYTDNLVTDSLTKYQTSDITENIEINISVIGEYAPVLKSLNDNTKVINLENAYNYRNVNYISKSNVYFNYLFLSGNSTGQYINYNGIRNEGDVTVQLNHATSTNMDVLGNNSTDPLRYKQLRVYGCFEEVSDGFTAQNVFNGGSITVTTGNVAIYFNIYVSGICHKNASTSYVSKLGKDVFNPESDSFDAKIAGSLHNVINAGHLYYSYTGTGVYGTTRVAGISAINASVITTAYNIGNIYNENYIQNGSGLCPTGEFEVESGGISILNVGEYAGIRDSANNGEIVAVNKNATGDYNRWVGAAGITVRNDQLEYGASYEGENAGHIKQIICFSINYGDVYSYNALQLTSSWLEDLLQRIKEAHSKAGGIMSQGVCNVINVLNYGNVYGTRISAGIFGQVYFKKFQTEYGELGTNEYVSIANTINYGNVRYLEIGTDVPTYNINTNYINELNLIDNIFVRPVQTINPLEDVICAAAVGNLNGDNEALFGGASDISKIYFRFMVNFDQELDMIGYVQKVNYNSSVDKLINIQKYGDLTDSDNSQSPFNAIVSYTLDKFGIFAENFPLRDPSNIIGDTKPTDRFINDYIQFIPYTKVNEIIIDNLGWDKIALEIAYDSFLHDLERVTELINYKTIDNDTKLEEYYELIKTKYYSNLYVKKDESYTEVEEVLSTFWDLVKIDGVDADEMNEILKLFMNHEDELFYSENIRTAIVNHILQNIGKEEVLVLFNDYIKENEFERVFADLDFYEAREFINKILNYVGLTDAEIKTLFEEFYGDLIDENGNLDLGSLTKEQQIDFIVGFVPNLDTYKDELIAKYSAEHQTQFGSQELALENVINNLQVSSQYDSLYNAYELIKNSSEDGITLFWNYLSQNNNDVLYSIANQNANNNMLYYKAHEGDNVQIVDKSRGVLWNYDYNYNDTIINWQNDKQKTSAVYTGDYYTKDGISYSLAPDDSSYNEIQIIYARTQNSDSSYNSVLYTYEGNGYNRYEEGLFNSGALGTYSQGQYLISNSEDTGVFMKWRQDGPNHVGSLVFRTDYFYSDLLFAEYMGAPLTETTVVDGVQTTTNVLHTAINNREVVISQDDIDKFIEKYLDYLLTLGDDAECNAFLKAVMSYINQLDDDTTNDYNYLTFIQYLDVSNYTDKDYIEYILGTMSAENVKTEFDKIIDPTDPNFIRTAVLNYYVNAPDVFYEDFLEWNDNNKINDECKELVVLTITSSFLVKREDTQEEIDRIYDNYQTYINQKLITIEDILTYTLENEPELLDVYVEKKVNSRFYYLVMIEHLLKYATDEERDAFIKDYLGYDVYNDDNSINKTMLDDMLVDAGYSLDEYLDYVGIYALSSSMGILNGNFIPDNIDFISLDPVLGYDENDDPILDKEWRGGIDGEGNPDISVEDSVHHHFFIQMKQLKKAIATNIFDIELVSEDGKYIIPVSEIINEKDQKELVFYVAANDNEVKGTGYQINTSVGTYELSYGAAFEDKKDANYPKDEVQVVGTGVKLFGDGDIVRTKIGHIRVYAEDRTVSTVYTVKVIKTEARGVDELVDFKINTVSSTIPTTHPNYTIADKVPATGGTVRVDFDLSYVAYNISLNDRIALNHASWSGDVNDLMTSTMNNGIVTRPTDDNVAIGDGDVFFEFIIPADMPGGRYEFVLQLNDSTKVTVGFDKLANSNAVVEEFTFNGETITNPGTTYTSYVPVGTPFVESDFNLVDGKPAHLDDIRISEGATLAFASVNVTKQTTILPGTAVYGNLVQYLYTYTIQYTITPEEGQGATFTHIIVEQPTDKIEEIYRDGVRITDEFTDGVYNYEFKFEEQPNLRFDYDVNSFYFGTGYGTMRVETPDDQPIIGVSIVPIDGIGFEVSFAENAEPHVYQFRLVYESDIPMKDTDKSTYVFNEIIIEKLENTNSKLDNVKFITDTVIATLDTIIADDAISTEEFENLRNGVASDATKNKIAGTALIDKIYYTRDTSNEYHIIGLVSETAITNYTPTFTLPYGATVYKVYEHTDNKVYRYIDYVNTNGDDTITLLVSEDGVSVLDVSTKTATTIPVGYEMSATAGKVNDDSLAADFSPVLNNSTNKFELTYVQYRVYAQAWETTNSYYTDYNIAVHDITNNIRILLDIVAESEEVRDAVNYVFVGISSYKNRGYTTLEGAVRGDYNNYMSLYSRSDSNSLLYVNDGNFMVNQSGWHEFEVQVPDGYALKYEVVEGHGGWKTDAPHIYIAPSSVVTITVKLRITVVKVDNYDPSWGIIDNSNLGNN